MTERAIASGPRPALALALALATATAGCTIGTAATNLTAQAVSPLATAPVTDAEAVPDIQMTIYGNWCGPGTPPPGSNATPESLPPVDRLDALCMTHDLCFDDHGGTPTCSCNRDLLSRTRYLQYHDPSLSPEARAVMTLIVGWFSTAPCN